MPRILSFDVGIKALGVAVIEYCDIAALHAEINAGGGRLIDSADRVFAALLDPIQIVRLDVFDISADSMVEVTRHLKRILSGLPDADTILIENQFSFRGNTQIMSQILYHYADQNVSLVSPKKKNKLAIGGLQHSTFLSKYSSRYSANKAHTKAMILHWIHERGAASMIAHIPTAKQKDACDAAAQAIAWVWFGA